ncbi:FAD synthetase [Plasmodium cynomolgi strain B]|uniref:FAD synthase n=1 Tax=Plasmodium cynomolgi (strain B) TaxID=1120755 RepID=K6VAA2_PLACD|nr:FAD synthetase [Plasmodium cynomolgi strain B]GAB66087.1 FAD synthetase [Plasmodium cynomolgi strain B]
MASADEDEWNDYSNALKLSEKIEQLHKEHVKERNQLKEFSGRTSSDCYKPHQNENKIGNDAKNRDVIKRRMYNYDVINYYKDETILRKKIMELSDDIMTAIYHIYDIFRLCKDNVFLCAYAKYIHDVKGERKKPKLIYFKDEVNEFPEVYQFLNECVYMYDFDITVIKGTWKSSITKFIETFQKQHRISRIDQMKENFVDSCEFFPTIAFINGTRFNDTNSEKLQILNISSRGLPPYLYLNPVFYWTYGAIWTFILYFKFDYCILYNHGYSSIGSVHDTVKNEFLKCNDCYLPAYFLKNWDYERHNRVSPEENQGENS